MVDNAKARCMNDRGMVAEQPGYYMSSCCKLDTFDWMKDVPEAFQFMEVAEIRFKNTRKGVYRNVNGLRLSKGDLVAVEASPGHDIGIVSLTGELVLHQMKKSGIPDDFTELRKVYRKARPIDIDKWKEAIALEYDCMIRTREIVEQMKLDMKISDVEYQGDGTKAIFYYIASERVDFRELIRVLAEEFRIRVEMKQIGARQEAGRIGGIGSCGRELCCASWINSFVSVTTNAARHQEVTLNPQKLAGQCGKLKCCLNYEIHGYLDAQKDFPDKNVVLELERGNAFYQKTDVYRRLMWYAYEQESSTNLVPVPVERVSEIIKMNRQGIKFRDLIEHEGSRDAAKQQSEPEFFNEDTDASRKQGKSKKNKNPGRGRKKKTKQGQ